MAITRRKSGGDEGSTLQLYRRVPARYASVEERIFIRQSLHTDSMSAAKLKAEAIWQQLIEAWEAKLAGDTEDGEKQLEAARDLARARGFRYLRAEEVRSLPAADILERVEAVGGTEAKPDMIEARALLGGASEPPITVTRALELYWDLARDRIVGMSPDQIRRWENPRKKAVNNFVAQIGDKAIAGISGDDMLDFRAWWLDRVTAGEVGAGSANKDFTHLGDVLRTVVRAKRLKIVLPLDGLTIKEGEKPPRLPFSDSWIKEKILAPGALDSMNLEARVILVGMINTGCRPSEIANLTADQIRLEGKVPHISIEPVGRRLKTRNARRMIPLVGVSLEAMRACPQGFPRYRDNPGLSATQHSFLRENGLMETPKHVVYGLRHSFEDRMLHAGFTERIKADLMGHTLARERYGAGASLEHVHGLLQAIAL